MIDERHIHEDCLYSDYATCPVCNKETCGDIVVRVKILESRVAELEKRLSVGSGSPISMTGTSWYTYCPKCNVNTQHKPTGNALLTNPPQIEIVCVSCEITRGMAR